MDANRQKEVERAYKQGQLDKEKYGDMNAWAWDENEPTWDNLIDAAWELGWNDGEKPVYCSGWRWGDVPQKGKSYNYRDEYWEPGISMMYVETVDGYDYGTKDPVSATWVRQGREKVELSGWLVGFGSDGEPCILQ